MVTIVCYLADCCKNGVVILINNKPNSNCIRVLIIYLVTQYVVMRFYDYKESLYVGNT